MPTHAFALTKLDRYLIVYLSSGSSHRRKKLLSLRALINKSALKIANKTSFNAKGQKIKGEDLFSEKVRFSHANLKRKRFFFFFRDFCDETTMKVPLVFVCVFCMQMKS
jgi:hypothetical protein